ncbi:MAG: hypothetical protein AAGD05_19550 [Bacteroidota bacterium]
MRHQLSPEEEKLFWSFITNDLAQRLALPLNSSTWRIGQKKAIIAAMQKHLLPLCEKDPLIMGLCNFDEETTKKRKLHLESTIHNLFVNKNFRQTTSATKHRFTFFLEGISADEYIERKGLLQTQTATPLISIAPAQALQALQMYINHLEDMADRIQKVLSKEVDQKTAQKWLNRFLPLHKKLIQLLKNGDFVVASRVKKDIYHIFEEPLYPTKTQQPSVTRLQGLFVFYLRSEQVINTFQAYQVALLRMERLFI